MELETTAIVCAEEEILPPTKTPQKNIPIEKIIEYRKKGLSVREIARLLDCSHPNIVERLQKYTSDIDNLDSYKENRADVLALSGRKILNQLTDDRLKKASAYQLAGMYGVLYDKERLERGKSTQNVSYADYTRSLQALDSEIRQLEDELGITEAEFDELDPE